MQASALPRILCSGSSSARWRWARGCCRTCVRIWPMWCRCARARRSRPTTCARSSTTWSKVSRRSDLWPFRCECAGSLTRGGVSAGILPRSWCRYTVPAALTVIQWVADFSERIKQLQQISQGAASGGAKELKVQRTAASNTACITLTCISEYLNTCAPGFEDAREGVARLARLSKSVGRNCFDFKVPLLCHF